VSTTPQPAEGGQGVHSYGPDEGLPELRDALQAKVAAKNGLQGVRRLLQRMNRQHACQFVEGGWRTEHAHSAPCTAPFTAAPLQYEVMVTAGANQAFVNIVLSLVDAADRVVLFRWA
jgi:aspartate/methionine/tyrosine aminotransferase